MIASPRIRPLLLALFAVGLSGVQPAWALRPELRIILPRGVQRGTETEVTFHGARLEEPQQLLCYSPGIEAIAFNAEKPDAVKVKLRVAADCALGQHIVRLRTSGGLTDARTLYVGPYPLVEEKEPNNDFSSPQPIPYNSTVQGVVLDEDVDYYAVEVKKGQRISVEVEAMRLGTHLFDAYVAILNSKRFELAASDDTPLFMQDPFASVIAPEDGTYIIEVREASYDGDGESRYRLHVGQFPRPRIAFPLGGQEGAELSLQFLGDARDPYTKAFRLEPTRRGEQAVFPEEDGHGAVSPLRVRVSQFPSVNEVEPNNHYSTVAPATLSPPLGFNGILDKGDPEDWFRFQAKAGQELDVRVYAQRQGSPLDAVLEVWEVQSNSRINSNDDSGGPDSYLRFRPGKDGEYAIKLRDHLSLGGPTHAYRVEVTPVRAALSVEVPEFEQRSQQRNRVEVPRGNRFAQLFRVNRQDFGGPVNLTMPALPQGLTLSGGKVSEAVDAVVVVYEAADDAPVAGGLYEVNARHSDESRGISGSFQQKLELVYGQNNTPFYTTHVDRLAVAVTQPVPFKVHVDQPKAPVVRNGSKEVRVRVERSEGFDGPVNLTWLWNPPGIGARGNVMVEKGQTEAMYGLTAAGNAQLGSWDVAILASADTPKGPVFTSSQLFQLTVAEPFLAMSIDRAAAEQGQKVDLVCKLTHQTPFEGKARVLLHGVPAHVVPEAQEKEITKDDKEVVFALNVGKEARPGQHKDLFCQVVVTQAGEPVSHSVGGGAVLRIDPPPPPKKEAPPPAPTPAPAAEQPKPAPPPPPKPPEERRLSRLERLRLEAAERAKQQAAGK